MPHAESGVGHIFPGQFFIKGSQFAFGTDQLNLLVLHSGNTRRIITSVFKTSKTFYNERHGWTVSGVSDNSTHI